MRSKAPKVKRNEILTLSDRKHFAAMIRSGAKYREVLQEHLRIFKKTWESHCKQVILDCHRRTFAIKLNVKTVQQVLINEF